MAQFSLGRLTELDSGFVLAPERYDPRKHSLESELTGRRLHDFVEVRRQIISKSTKGIDSCLIFDTGDAQHGFLTKAHREISRRDDIGSAKKLVKAGDVIISRLRSYLKQIAWIDSGICEAGITIAVSTEFYVLSPKEPERKSIAFLVPFLRSIEVQSILAASQEGGHHPRFHERVLIELNMPDALIECRDSLSHEVESAVLMARNYENSIKKADLLASATLSSKVSLQ
jgi:hypothetical protein